MNSALQSTQQRHPADLAALHQKLQELAATTKSSVPAGKTRQAVVQGPVLVVRGK